MNAAEVFWDVSVGRRVGVAVVEGTTKRTDVLNDVTTGIDEEVLEDEELDVDEDDFVVDVDVEEDEVVGVGVVVEEVLDDEEVVC